MLRFSLVLILLVSFATTAPQRYKRDNACYGKLGCISTDGFFSIRRPISLLPSSRASINTQFRLYTRQNKDVDNVIRADFPLTLNISYFNDKNPTKFLVHGFTDNGFKPWIMSMKDEFLKYADLNVFVVDWGSGSHPPYTQATANTLLVGAEIAYMIKYLEKKTKLRRDNVHIIGHSLGSHIAGYAGARLRGLARITGLDPAGPYFEYTSDLVQLDPTDADFVDTIHSDARNILRLGFGMSQPCGHVDYYPNGGNHQPGCDKDPFTFISINGLEGGAVNYVACDHMRSVYLFTESINSKCGFLSSRCNSYSDYKVGKCYPQHGAHMGLHADKFKPPKGTENVKMYLETSDKDPFCQMHYKVIFNVGATISGKNKERGTLFIQLIGTNSQTEMIEISNGDVYLDPNQKLAFPMKIKKDIGKITAFNLKWKHAWTLFGPSSDTLYVFKIEIINGDGEVLMSCHLIYDKVKENDIRNFKVSKTC